MAQVGVITGDLVGSTKAGSEAVAQSFAVLHDTCCGIAEWTERSPRFTRFRGDGWQVVIAPERRALRAALMIRARLSADKSLVATRMALGFGEMTSGGGSDLSDADGPAFHRSGRLLESLPRRRRFAIDAEGAPDPLSPALGTVLDALAGHWSPLQAETVALALALPRQTQAEIGTQLSLSQQAVQDRLDNADFWALEEVLAELERGDD